MNVFFNIIKETDLCIFNIVFYVTVAVKEVVWERNEQMLEVY